MKMPGIRYTIKTATEDEIFLHLVECSDSFIPPLAKRVDIKEYAKKLTAKAQTFEAWADELLVGFLAVYFDDNTKGIAFITNVSVLNRFVGCGIASNLLNMCFEHAKNKQSREITLEVNEQNRAAICFYKKFSFSIYETNGDTLSMKKKI